MTATQNVCRNRARTEDCDFSCRVNECSGSRLGYSALTEWLARQLRNQANHRTTQETYMLFRCHHLRDLSRAGPEEMERGLPCTTVKPYLTCKFPRKNEDGFHCAAVVTDSQEPFIVTHGFVVLFSRIRIGANYDASDLARITSRCVLMGKAVEPEPRPTRAIADS